MWISHICFQRPRGLALRRNETLLQPLRELCACASIFLKPLQDRHRRVCEECYSCMLHATNDECHIERASPKCHASNTWLQEPLDRGALTGASPTKMLNVLRAKKWRAISR